MRSFHFLFYILFFCAFHFNAAAQTTDRPRPAEWAHLINGGRFMDRFLPMTNNGLPARNNTWGGSNVLPRYVENGIEDPAWSFWCANIKYEAGKYHMFVVGWPESSPKGHATWPQSTLFHAVSDNMTGPFIIRDTIGKGHNAEGFRLKDGRWIVYVIDGYYISDNINGPWTYAKFDFQQRGRPVIDGMSNCSFAQREDGSFLMVNRGGGIWFSKTGQSSYYQISDHKVYPLIKGNFEDPVVWRDNIQYNLIVNDWLGRIAYYLRSKDGVEWKIEAGEAYMPGIARHADGTVEDWHKFERMRVFQDAYGRAIQANFAVIDIEKAMDKASDAHSSKNITIPLLPGRLLTMPDKQKIKAGTKTIRVKISAEADLDPQKDIDLSSLHFGGSEEVNFGKGSTKVLRTERSGKDLIITFDAGGNGIPENDYAAKLIGQTKDGKLFYGYARLPWVSFTDPILSAEPPTIERAPTGSSLQTVVQNFGRYASKNAALTISYLENDHEVLVTRGRIPPLQPFEKMSIDLHTDKVFEHGIDHNFVLTISQDGLSPVLLHWKFSSVQ